MELKNASDTRAQSSIRSFFQPRQPNYTAPPVALPAGGDTSTPPPTSGLLSPPKSSPILSPLPSTTSPSLPTGKFIPAEATISPVTKAHISPLKRINALLLPIAYPDSFYNSILSPPQSSPQISFSRIITWNSTPSTPTVVGGLVCRVDPALAVDSTPQAPKFMEGFYDIYIQSLALLSPYRGHALATTALQEVIDAAASQQEIKVASLYAHVWTDNEDGLSWYSKRGFVREDPILHGYYKRLKPDTAWLVRRRLNIYDYTSQTLSKTISAPNATTVIRPPPRPSPTARSFQSLGPEREWNDLPEDVLVSKPPAYLSPQEESAASSRSSSRSGLEAKEKAGKKKRVYPAAAFGGS